MSETVSKAEFMAEVRRILKADKTKWVAVETFYPDYDHCEGVSTDGGRRYTPVTRRDVYNAIKGYAKQRHFDDKPPADIEDVKRLYDDIGDHDFGYVILIDAKQAKKDQDEAEYKVMEQKAQNFAGKCGFALGTKDFLKALSREVKDISHRQERWNDGETRMEQWAAHAFSGGGSESYFDDLNYENGRFQSAREDCRAIWEYLGRKFPIMMMRFEEAQARKRQAKKSN